MGLFGKSRKAKNESNEKQTSKRNEINNSELKQSLANTAISTLRQGEDYNDLAFTTVEFGYIFTIDAHGFEALFKVITDKGIYYFAAQKTSVMRLDFDEAHFKFATEEFFELNKDLIVGWEEMPIDAARRLRSISILKEKGIPYLPQLYVIVPESETQLRTPEEIARRCLAMFGVCVYSEARSSGESWEGAQKYLNRIDDFLCGGLDEALSPEEKLYTAEKEPTQGAVAKFGWRYECCYVLMWALGIIEELGFPDGLCDVSRMGGIVWRLESMDDFLKGGKPRGREEILDMADLILLYDWACVDARINNRESPAGLNGGVVQEWHYAFEWLVGTNEKADWDDVIVST